MNPQNRQKQTQQLPQLHTIQITGHILTCAQCTQSFDVTDVDQEFLRGMGLSLPKLCPVCRRQRRLAFRNERRMYYRECDESHERMIALYPDHPKKKIVTYEQKKWWDYDKMNPLEFGRDYDFSRPFFDQYAELKSIVPRPNLHNTNVENAMYGNHCVGNKDCYMNVGSDLCEGCQLTYWAIRCTDCLDCSLIYDCELCHNCVDLRLSFNCEQVDLSESMIDSSYCYDCIGSQQCFGCVGLRHKNNFFLNQELTKEQYDAQVNHVMTNPTAMRDFLKSYQELRKQSVYCCVKNPQSEDVLGDRLWKCRGCQYSFDLEKCEDVNYCTFGFDGTTSEDMDFFGEIEKMYEGFSAFGQYNCIATIMCHYSHDVHYSEYCISSHHAFGCTSLHHHSYCILNKQYKQQEYEELMLRIIEHMKSTGEWGEFFPMELSPFPYNITVAQKFYPLTKDQIESKGLLYEDEEAIDKERDRHQQTAFTSLSADESAIDASVCKSILRCENSGRPYQMTPKEFEYLRERKLLLPRLHPDVRNEQRMARRSAQKLWDRTCAVCKKTVVSSYDPATGQPVYCESCYEKHVY